MSFEGTLAVNFPPTAQGTNRNSEIETFGFAPVMPVSISFNGQWLFNLTNENYLALDHELYLNGSYAEHYTNCPAVKQAVGPGLAGGTYPVSLARNCNADFVIFPNHIGSDLAYSLCSGFRCDLYAASNRPGERVIFYLSANVTTTYLVNSEAGLGLDVTHIEFQAGATNPAPKLIEVSNSGTSNLIFSVTTTTADGGDWLTVSPTEGIVLAHDSTNLTVTVSVDKLPLQQTNTATIAVSGNAPDSPRVVTVRVTRRTARLVGLEVNQVVQDWSNSIPLIAGKTTTVRAHLQSLGGQPVRVASALRGFRNGTELLPPLAPMNPGGFITAQPDFPNRREVLNSSLNFRLPTNWTFGTVTLQLDTNAVGCAEAAGTPGDCAVTVTFLKPVTPRLKVIGISWTGNDGVLCSNSPAQLAALRSRLVSCYPVATVDFTTSEFPWLRSVPPQPGDALSAVSWTHLWDEMSSWTPPQAWIYYGAVAGMPAPRMAGGMGYCPGTDSTGYMPSDPFGYARHMHSHEIGHNLGQQHPTDLGLFGITQTTYGPYVYVEINGACGDTAPLNTPAFPYFNNVGGSLRPTLGPMSGGPDALVYGYDHDVGQVVSPYQYFETMSYCGGRKPLDTWPSKFTYTAWLSALSSRFAQPTPPGPPTKSSFRLVRGRIDLPTDVASFQPFATVQASHVPPEPAPGDYWLRLLDNSSQVVRQISFAPEQAIPMGDEPPLMSFIIPVPEDPAVRQVQVLHGSLVIGAHSASAHSPTVHLVSPNGGEQLSADSVRVAWSASDPDGDLLTYTLQFSPDDGATWQTLGVDLISTNYTLPRRLLQGTGAGRIRVVVSDGFDSDMDVSDGAFSVASSPPEVYLHSPATGALLLSGQQAVFEALAYDRQDGVLDGTNVVWSSDLDGLLGTGSSWLTTASALTEGMHEITVTARNSSNLVASAQVAITVLYSNSTGVADLAITQTSDVVGDGLSFVLTVQNLGPDDATGLKITDALPANTTVVSASSTLGSCIITNGLLTCSLSQLAMGESAVVTLRLAAHSTGSYTNLADVKGMELDPELVNNLAQVVVRCATTAPRLQCERAGDCVKLAWPGTTPTNFILQASPNLSPATWSDVAGTPETVNGRYQLIQGITNASRYYRLLSR